MWVVLQITGCLAITAALTYMRVAGLNITTYSVYVFVQAAFIGWAFPISYKLAPSFLQAWFLGNVTLALGGFAVSLFYLTEVLPIHTYVGAIMAFVGAILLII